MPMVFLVCLKACVQCQCESTVSLSLRLPTHEFLIFSRSFWYLQRQGVQFSSLVLQFGNWPTLSSEDLNRAQSVYFLTLVIMQWGYGYGIETSPNHGSSYLVLAEIYWQRGVAS